MNVATLIEERIERNVGRKRNIPVDLVWVEVLVCFSEEEEEVKRVWWVLIPLEVVREDLPDSVSCA